ncbi:hypothetical protein BDF14DRAFT_1735907 [Spinellus fusiger]|nr:hypothetical protein BDF14DRAFT_1735907 [Spinellus fusiger]
MLQRLSRRLYSLPRHSTPTLFVSRHCPQVALGWTRPSLISSQITRTVSPLHPHLCSFHSTRHSPRSANSTPPVKSSLDPATYKTLAFYHICSLEKKDLGPWRDQLLSDLKQWHIVGRIYLSTEGINAQISCPEQYMEALSDYYTSEIQPRLGPNVMDLNLGTEHGQRSFRALHVRIRKQLVADGLDPSTYDLSQQPSHLPPSEWHQKLTEYKEKHGKEPVLIDMRNHYESQIGYFEGAVRPDVNTFRESIQAMNSIVKDLPRDQEIFMYCTGGIRCSKAGAILQTQSGFDTVHLVQGGITAYGHWIRQQNVTSLYRGKNFTFDARLGEAITEEVTKIHFQPSGPVVVEGVRAYVKEGQMNMQPRTGPSDPSDPSDPSERVVVGQCGVECEHEHHRRLRAIEVLGKPGQVLQEWAKAGRELPSQHSL